MLGSDCPLCKGKRLKKEALSVKFANKDISEIGSQSLEQLYELLEPYAKETRTDDSKTRVLQRIAEDIVARISVLKKLGLGYLSLNRSTPTLSPGELQRLRLATVVRAILFGVVYVLD